MLLKYTKSRHLLKRNKTHTNPQSKLIKYNLKMFHVSSANYPIAQPLATILNSVIEAEKLPSSLNLDIEVEPASDALQHFINNCFVAMDNVFFSTYVVYICS